MPAYLAQELGYFRKRGLDVRIRVQPTAWIVPEQLEQSEIQFAVIPWTRVAASAARGKNLVAICGSGYEEAAIVLRTGCRLDDVERVAIPQEGGIKDLTATEFLRQLGWLDREIVRMPSGDGAILAFIGNAADAAVMVEPYATMLEAQGAAQIIRRTGDLWKGAPGCSLSTTWTLIEQDPELVEQVLAAFLAGAEFIRNAPDEAAEIAEGYIGISRTYIRKALEVNRPNPLALESEEAIDSILQLMQSLGYLETLPDSFTQLEPLRGLLAEAAKTTT